MQAAQLGVSLAIRLPTFVVKALDLKSSDDVDVFVAGSDTFSLPKAQRAVANSHAP